ncbi:MAG: hypothetical protein H0X62_03830 [Bacteroidetes bacterium]|nr:hypothetical protein [Bacteroidota bacterium]
MSHSFIKAAVSIVFLALIAIPAFAQSSTLPAEGVTALTEVKNEILNEKSYTSIFMIAGVVAIVALAIYLSFSNEQEEKQVKK